MLCGGCAYIVHRSIPAPVGACVVCVVSVYCKHRCINPAQEPNKSLWICSPPQVALVKKTRQSLPYCVLPCSGSQMDVGSCSGCTIATCRHVVAHCQGQHWLATQLLQDVHPSDQQKCRDVFPAADGAQYPGRGECSWLLWPRCLILQRINIGVTERSAHA